MKNYNYLCIILLIIVFNSSFTNLYSSQNKNHQEIGELAIPNNIINRNDIIKLQFYAYSNLSQISIEIKENSGNYYTNKNYSLVGKDKNLDFGVELDKIKLKKRESNISSYIETKNKSISMLDIFVKAKSEDNHDVYFSTRIVLEDIQNNQVKIWRLHEYFQSNGKNEGMLIL